MHTGKSVVVERLPAGCKRAACRGPGVVSTLRAVCIGAPEPTRPTCTTGQLTRVPGQLSISKAKRLQTPQGASKGDPQNVDIMGNAYTHAYPHPSFSCRRLGAPQGVRVRGRHGRGGPLDGGGGAAVQPAHVAAHVRLHQRWGGGGGAGACGDTHSPMPYWTRDRGAHPKAGQQQGSAGVSAVYVWRRMGV